MEKENGKPKCSKCSYSCNTAYIFNRPDKKGAWIKIGYYCFGCKVFVDSEGKVYE